MLTNIDLLTKLIFMALYILALKVPLISN